MRGLVDFVTRVLLWSRRGRQVDPTVHPVKVNLGSGLVVADGWINLEGSAHAWVGKLPTWMMRPAYFASGSSHELSFEEYQATLRKNRFVPHDLRSGIPFPADTVDYVYAARVLETLFLDETSYLLRDAARVLRPNGRIRLLVNDFDARLRRFQEGDRAGVIYSLFGGSDSTMLNSHRSTYNFDLISDLLSEAGFVHIQRRGFRDGRVPDLDALEHRPWEALFVEASVPG